MSGLSTEEFGARLREHLPLPEIARLLIPVGMGVLTWLLLLLFGGGVLSMGSLSPLSLIVPVVLAMLFMPVYRFRPWREGLTQRVVAFVDRRRFAVLTTLGLFVLVRLPILSETLAPILAILLLPVRAVPQLLFGVRLYYATHITQVAGDLIFEFGRGYVEVLWLYLIATGMVWLWPGGSE